MLAGMCVSAILFTHLDRHQTYTVLVQWFSVIAGVC